ncbi:hypothetical protein OPU71_20710 [Niveibacterium sp. 24ML]|uniref:hypothetical protein n=1 Tax=Niveibacterium sp. 24ML TaxID=2985512 RepID=UPI00227160FE|nr:hypothetical protein [Niveibacterium sp. 24ML]MCX9158551.1 hypothetical protein [Niveibacterium sp. 24ML]
MSDEAPANMVLALGDAVDSLIEQAERQQKVAEGVLAAGKEALDVVSRAAKEQRVLTTDLPRQVQEAIIGALDGAATKAAGALSSQFTEANEQAERAARRYENAARALRWKVVAACAGAWAATVTLMVSAGWYMSGEIRTLYEDSRMLATAVTYLKDKPQGAQLALCDRHNDTRDLCVYVQTAKNKWEWRVLAKRSETAPGH